ncbi:MAG: DUF378 domain-containing protein [Actinomycetota bacterium]|jgi:uncharacterized membrane protein YuzA (DUF378 family)|nr:DUF378 domain-containing protein [Actinomycetota bacterium]
MAANGALDRTALALVTVGGINWGLVGLFDFDLVAKLFGNRSALSRTVYSLVGAGAVYTLGRAATSSE